MNRKIRHFLLFAFYFLLLSACAAPKTESSAVQQTPPTALSPSETGPVQTESASEGMRTQSKSTRLSWFGAPAQNEYLVCRVWAVHILSYCNGG